MSPVGKCRKQQQQQQQPTWPGRTDLCEAGDNVLAGNRQCTQTPDLLITQTHAGTWIRPMLNSHMQLIYDTFKWLIIIQSGCSQTYVWNIKLEFNMCLYNFNLPYPDIPFHI